MGLFFEYWMIVEDEVVVDEVFVKLFIIEIGAWKTFEEE